MSVLDISSDGVTLALKEAATDVSQSGIKDISEDTAILDIGDPEAAS